MGWLVEYWEVPKVSSGSHAQMREQKRWIKPENADILRRYFDDYKAATRFAQSMFDRGGFYASVIKDG